MKNTINILLLLLLFACSEEEKDTVKQGKGGKMYGSTFSYMSYEKPTHLLPISHTGPYSQRILSQMFETLLAIEPTELKNTANIAKIVKSNEKGDEFTIQLNKKIYFHENECFDDQLTELKAQDVKFTFELACSNLFENEISSLLIPMLKNARKDLKKASKTKVPKLSAIEIINDYTLKIKLSHPNVTFDKVLSHPSLAIISLKAFEYYGKDLSKHPIGTGPFIFDLKNDKEMVLKRNKHYWKKDEFGNQLPFLAAVKVIFNNNKTKEFAAFQNQKIDAVLEIPALQIKNTLGTLQDAQHGKNIKHKIFSTNALSTRFIGFYCDNKLFTANLRLAIHLAINKNSIIENELKGDGLYSGKGLVPYMSNYSNYEIAGLNEDVARAKALLAKEGYPNGANFPNIEIYISSNKGGKDFEMVNAINKQLKEKLNISFKIKSVGFEQKMKAIQTGKAKVWVGGYVADYPDPEAFFRIFHSENKVFKFIDPQFDRMLEAAVKTKDKAKRIKLYEECDQYLMEKSPVIPIYSDDYIVMMNLRVRDFQTSPMGTLDLSRVYIKEIKN